MKTIIYAILILSLFATVSTAERLPVDGIVASVNDDIILASEVGEEVTTRIYQYGAEAVASMGMEKLASMVLEEMVNNKLLLQKSDELDIIVTKEEVAPAVEQNLEMLRSQYTSEEEFTAMLEEYGMTEKKLMKQYRKNIKEQYMIRNLVDIEIMPNIEISEDETKQHYELHKSEYDVPTMVTISELVIAKVISPDSVRKTEAMANSIRAKALSGTDFALLVKQYSKATNAASGGYFSFSKGETYPEIENAVMTLTPGQISKPITLPDGLWIIKLVEISAAGTYKTQYIFLPVELSSYDITASRKTAEGAYAELRAGAEFADVANKYNEDPTMESNGGYVGQFPLSNLVQEFPTIAHELETLSPGEYTNIMERPEGYYIVKLDDVEEGTARNYEEARSDVVADLRMEQVDAELVEYVAELKENAYIKYYE